jgi:acylpyruvate hydrolase
LSSATIDTYQGKESGVKLATIRLGDDTAAVRIDAGQAVEIGARDVGTLLQEHDWRARAERADGSRHPIDAVDYAPLVPRPDKIICVGLNYRSHILEMGRELPEYPTLFAKFTSALIGAQDDIALPAVSQQVDWEAELAVIIGARTRNVSVDDASDAIAGYAVLNDISARDWQMRTLQWLQGKTFEASTPLGPHLVTRDEAGDEHELSCEVDGELMQKASTGDLVFGPAELVAYISQILTLEPGDVIASGTPGGVGAAQQPPRYLADGSVVVTRIGGVGTCRNVCRRD